MKLLFLIAISLPAWAFAQPYALLHRQLMQPAEVTNQLEPGITGAHFFPVHTSDLNALIKVLDHYIDSMQGRQGASMQTEVRVGHSRLLIQQATKKEKGSAISLFTRAKDFGFTYELVSKEDSKLRGLQKMKAFLYYLRNNRVVVQEQTGALPVKGF